MPDDSGDIPACFGVVSTRLTAGDRHRRVARIMLRSLSGRDANFVMSKGIA